MARMAAAALLGASLATVLLFDVIGPFAPFVSWGLCLAALGLLAKEGSSRRLAHISISALVSCVFGSVALTGIVIGMNGRPTFPCPTIDIYAAAWALGVGASWHVQVVVRLTSSSSSRLHL